MEDPMCDFYPTETELQTIKDWPLENYNDYLKLAEFICNLWSEHGRAELIGHHVKKLILHTGGWSGNESIMGALEETMFQIVCWEKSERGGHYIYILRPFN